MRKFILPLQNKLANKAVPQIGFVYSERKTFMLITIEIPEELDQKMSSVTQELNLSKVALIRLALEKFLSSHDEPEPYPYSKVKDFIGVGNSGIPDLGTNHEKHLAQLWRRK